MRNAKIACIIVTYNRKTLLKRCLEAVNAQTYKPTCVYITDNASTDGTIDSVQEWGFYNCCKNEIEYKYILNKKNEGGAGGFYLGMKTAFEENKFDALWVMDDDGQPDRNCLETLIPYLKTKDYIAPIVLSDEDHETCSFIPECTYAEICNKADHNGVIENWASPFNGILFSSHFIKQIGFPKKEMFIWGDERNYHLRSIAKGIIPVTIINAIHYHPIDRQSFATVGKEGKVLRVNNNWKLYCYLRNIVYNSFRHDNSISLFRHFLRETNTIFKYMYYYTCKEHKYKAPLIILDAYFSGMIGYFGGLNKYLKA